MANFLVSIVKHTDTYGALKKSIELCNGLKDFKKNDKILIKPNLVSWDFDLPFPPYGVVTTSAVMFALVQILYEEGYSRVTIGEASLGVSGSMAKNIFKVLGYEKLREKFGVKLVDFNEDKFVAVDVGGFKLSIAQKALEADKIINVPVLKTHNQCKVSLGIKNLKGCLNRTSKKQCHGRDEELEHMFPHIAEKLPVALTIIDGIFALAKGPGATGKAVRKDLLVASRNILACDMVGAALIGYNASEVEHLKYFAQRSRQVINLADIEVLGESIEKHAEYLESDWAWTEDNSGPAGFKKRGIKGIAIRKYDSSLCTACSKLYNPMLILLSSAFKGEPFPGIEVLTGKRQKASPGFEKTILFGKCACMQNKDNPNIKKAVFIKGCPPDLNEFQRLLHEEGIECNYDQYVSYRHYIYDRYEDKDGFDMGLFKII
ncbi:DUF362 domain-containing protein [Desulfoscipio geothermicus]|uniref:Uncharacterized conserved protein, DUF362 family n=1 Tax=Desulfoscipio geothermicus DSM 3669 TaxID=1121426 RepID=A0A1I6DGN8_9FIRM|nr:DUF362 domain-containing protein [Desulfoscipio geothermicus]SFR04609.1 Uncharacterized conserved protein, DUF362 family [Desulfoscipio geothermicus DSM 3669]